MIEVKIPKKGEFIIDNLLLDYNGTLAFDGYLVEGIGEAINRLADLVNLYVVTADTNGTVNEALKDYDVKIIHLKSSDERNEKFEKLLELGAERTIAIGNGKNDELMLREAAIGICIMGNEGCATDTLMASDIVVKDILEGIGLVSNQNRMKATLRY